MNTFLERRRRIERKYNLKRYMLTPERFEEYKLRQRGVCAVCGRSLDDEGVKVCVDHIHDTTIVRGLLCNGCNVGIGMFKENPQVLRAAADYLEAYGR